MTSKRRVPPWESESERGVGELLNRAQSTGRTLVAVGSYPRVRFERPQSKTT